MFFNVTQRSANQRSSNWNIDDGYETKAEDEKPYPYRVIGAGLQYSLIVILKINKYDIDPLCGGKTQGFRIGFHSPGDIARVKKNFFDLSPKQAVFYSIEPKYIETTKEVRKFTPHQRQCFLNTERKLRFYRQYTRNNCLLECLSNYILAQCGCVRFSMLRMYIFKLCSIIIEHTIYKLTSKSFLKK